MGTMPSNAHTTELGFTLKDTDTCLSRLIRICEQSPHLVLYYRPRNFEWVSVTAAEFLEEVYEVAKGLVAAGIQPGDRVAILSSTRYEWSLVDFAIWAAGAASVPSAPIAAVARTRP